MSMPRIVDVLPGTYRFGRYHDEMVSQTPQLHKGIPLLGCDPSQPDDPNHIGC